MKKIILILILLAYTNCKAQDNTLQLTEGSTSPQANLEDVSWIHGHWKGNAFGGIRQVDSTLIFQLKHFGNDFKGWEEKDETIDAKLVKIEGNRVYFEGFTFEKTNENEIAIYVLIEDKGKNEEVKFNYYRQ